MRVILDDMMYIEDAPKELLDKVKDNLTYENKAYANALRYSKYTKINIPKHIHYYVPTTKGIAIPRGFKLPFDNYIVEDKRIENTVNYPKSKITLREDQNKAFQNYLDDPDKGLLLLQTGKGKSILGLYIAYALRQKTLIIVHKNDLVDGWQKDAKVVFGEEMTTGLIKAKKKDIGEQITIATIQTLNKQSQEFLDTLYNMFGCVIVDETHHVGSKNYDLVNNFKGAYRIGLTATLERGDNLEDIVYNIFGGVAYKQPINKYDKDILPVDVNMIQSSINYEPKLLYQGVNSKTKEPRYKYIKFEEESNYNNLVTVSDVKVKNRPNIPYHDIDNRIVEDSVFSNRVCKDIVAQVTQGKSCLAFFSKKKHIDLYYDLLSKYLDKNLILKYYGDSKGSKDDMKQLAESRKAMITLATYSIATEGTNVKAWEVAFLVSSLNNAKNVEQAIGRVRRIDGIKKRARVFDYYHPNVYTVSRHHYTRISRYNKLKLNLNYENPQNKVIQNNRLFHRGF